MARKQTFKRRPNKAGTVVKLSGKRRKPYCAKISDTERDIITGKKKQIVIGTFETELEALNALSLYYLTNKKTITDKEANQLAPELYSKLIMQREKNMPTFANLYEEFEKKYFSKFSEATKRRYKANFKRLKQIHDAKITELSLKKIQDVFDGLKDNTTKDTLSDTKILVKKIFKVAIIKELISKENDLTEYINIDTDYVGKKIEHNPFDISEIRKLINDNSIEAKIILIYIFTGCRASELLNLPKKNIHINEVNNDDGDNKRVSYLIAGSKSEAGKNRIIPIHKFIEPFIIELIEKDDIFLYYPQKSPYDAFKKQIFLPTMKRLNMNHLPHDTRHTFGTLATLYKLDNYMTKKILGHKFQDLTKDVYTHTLINKLYEEIHKIKL